MQDRFRVRECMEMCVYVRARFMKDEGVCVCGCDGEDVFVGCDHKSVCVGVNRSKHMCGRVCRCACGFVCVRACA